MIQIEAKLIIPYSPSNFKNAFENLHFTVEDTCEEYWTITHPAFSDWETKLFKDENSYAFERNKPNYLDIIHKALFEW